ncbi:MAG: hypothetical protein R3C49_00835 [Planctomycetaceae bacterium]
MAPVTPQELQWQAVPGAESYRVFLTNITTGQVGVVDTQVQSESLDVAGLNLSGGRYVIWIQSIAADGFRTQWSKSVQDITTEPLSPLNPVLDERPVFSWTASRGAVSYDIYIAGPGGVISETGLQEPTFTPTADLPSGRYRWWVRSRYETDGEPKTGPWSSVAEFSIGGQTWILAPINPYSLDIVWPPVTSATSYEVFVAREGSSAPVFRQEGITVNGYGLPPLESGNYRAWSAPYCRMVAASGVLLSRSQPAQTDRKRFPHRFRSAPRSPVSILSPSCSGIPTVHPGTQFSD